MIIHVTDNTFIEEVLKSNIPVLVDFWADWCGPCKILSPVIDDLAIELINKVKVVKINIADNFKISSQFNIRSIPIIFLFKNGKVLDKKIGFLSKKNILEWIDSILN